MRLLLDADALIKLNRAEILVPLFESTECAIPQAVYEEAVVEGHARGYADAKEIESALKERCSVEEATSSSRLRALGAGDTALLTLAEVGDESIVVSDDGPFLGVLRARGIDYLNCAQLVVYLVRNQVLTADRASKALGRMQSLISPKSFNEATEMLDSL